MMLMCRAYSPNDFIGPDFAGLDLTAPVLNSLRGKQKQAAELAAGPVSEALDSLVFREPRVVWFVWSDALDGVLTDAERDGWRMVEDAVLPDRMFPCGPRVCTENSRMQVWPDRFRFTCTLGDSETVVCSETVPFDCLPGSVEAGERREHVDAAETG